MAERSIAHHQGTHLPDPGRGRVFISFPDADIPESLTIFHDDTHAFRYTLVNPNAIYGVAAYDVERIGGNSTEAGAHGNS
jgi:hypothetical protein